MTTALQATEPTNAAFAQLVELLLPADGSDRLNGVWSHGVLPRGLSAPGLFAAAISREWGLHSARLRSRARPRRNAVHRIRPGMQSAGPRARALALLRSGSVVELAPSKQRGIDQVAAACGATTSGRLRAGAGGVVLVDAMISGAPALLRIARSEAQLSRERAALTRLDDTAGRVPQLLATGSSEKVAWLAESRLPGRRPGRLTRMLLDDILDFECRLPRPDAGAATVRPDIDALSELFPRHLDRLASLAAAVDHGLQDVPWATGHGDLWSGNLLVRHGRLTGVVDWDAYSDRIVPGVDLLHLFATEIALRMHRPRGTVLIDHPWAGEEFRDATLSYWRALGIRLTPSLLASISVAWWARQTATDVRRNPALRENVGWVSSNIDNVVDRAHQRF